VLVEHDAEVAGALAHLVQSTTAVAQEVDERHTLGIEQLEGEPHALGRIFDPGEGIRDVSK
jgi:4'-phosphopantetheinyl transferase EntD